MTTTPPPSEGRHLPACVELGPDEEHVARIVAREAAELIRERERAGLETCLGLATGRTPLGVYREWIRLHERGELSFARVRTFNLDEYLDLPIGHPRSFRRAMDEALFEHVDLREDAIHIPPSDLRGAEVAAAALEYEHAIELAGGIDWQILGLGRNGHIGFNEPGSPAGSRTRCVALHPVTRADAAAAFGGLEHVPREAITMGIATIRAARRLRLLAFGEAKAPALVASFDGEPREEKPLSLLRDHPDLRCFVDPGAAGGWRSEAR